MDDGIEFFLEDRKVPLEIRVLFTKFVKDEISKKVIFKDEVMLENTMGRICHDHATSLWLRFINALRDKILDTDIEYDDIYLERI